MREWRRFVDGGDDGAGSRAEADEVLRGLLVEHQGVVRRRIDEIEQLGHIGRESQRRLLKARWVQILALLASAVGRLRA